MFFIAERVFFLFYLNSRKSCVIVNFYKDYFFLIINHLKIKDRNICIC